MATENPDRPKLVTQQTIPGTNVPDVHKAPAESDAQKRWMARVGVTTAVLATCASIATMFSSSHLNKAMLCQIQAADKWSHFQAKGIKLAVLEGRIDLLKSLKPDAESAASGKPGAETDVAKAARYNKEQEEIATDAKADQDAAADHGMRHARLANASTAFQISIALSAVALLTRRNAFWVLSVVVGLAGAGLMAYGFWPQA